MNPQAADGPALYGTLCAECHGLLADGGTGPALNQWPESRALLIGKISQTMPPTTTSLCTGACATVIADYILDELQAEALDPSCEARLPPRQLRLLTRREYRNTVRDLLEPPTTECVDLGPCRWRTQSCSSNRCVNDACDRATFAYQGSGNEGEVLVAGSFNNWASTAAEGTWPMTFHASAGAWIIKRDLPRGEHQYKFVVDGQWINDPDNPERVSDGFGGHNSLMRVDCSSGGGDDVTAHFPPESRSSHFFFDNEAGGQVVSTVLASEHLDAADTIAAQLVAGLEGHAGCRAEDTGCAATVAETIGRRILRRPLTDAEKVRFEATVAGASSPELGVQEGLQTLLASPHFLYRFELGVEGMDGSFQLDPWETASALSYFLWGSMPDDALLDAAARGALTTDAELRAHADRLLADPKSRDHVADFAVQWLGVEKILTNDKNRAMFGELSDTLRRAMLDETRELVVSVVFDGGRFEDLLTSRDTTVTPELAQLYGVTVRADGRARIDGDGRSGLLGHASVLGTYAYSDQSSPVRRGLFVRERLLCQTLPAPPANAGGIPEVDPNATTKERFEQHSADPFCRSCHQHIDPVGFGFERFDAIGRYRTEENGRPIDGEGAIDGLERLGIGDAERFGTLFGLGELLALSPRSKACLAIQLHRFATGGETDRCTEAKMADRFEAAGHDVRALLIELAASPQLIVRRAP